MSTRANCDARYTDQFPPPRDGLPPTPNSAISPPPRGALPPTPNSSRSHPGPSGKTRTHGPSTALPPSIRPLLPLPLAPRRSTPETPPLTPAEPQELSESQWEDVPSVVRRTPSRRRGTIYAGGSRRQRLSGGSGRSVGVARPRVVRVYTAPPVTSPVLPSLPLATPPFPSQHASLLPLATAPFPSHPASLLPQISRPSAAPPRDDSLRGNAGGQFVLMAPPKRVHAKRTSLGKRPSGGGQERMPSDPVKARPVEARGGKATLKQVGREIRRPGGERWTAGSVAKPANPEYREKAMANLRIRTEAAIAAVASDTKAQRHAAYIPGPIRLDLSFGTPVYGPGAFNTATRGKRSDSPVEDAVVDDIVSFFESLGIEVPMSGLGTFWVESPVKHDSALSLPSKPLIAQDPWAEEDRQAESLMQTRELSSSTLGSYTQSIVADDVSSELPMRSSYASRVTPPSLRAYPPPNYPPSLTQTSPRWDAGSISPPLSTVTSLGPKHGHRKPAQPPPSRMSFRRLLNSASAIV